MALPVAETNGVIEASASHVVSISSRLTVNGANGDGMENVREPAAVVSRRNTANATIHFRRMVVVTVLVNRSNIGAVVRGSAHRELLISGILWIQTSFQIIPYLN